MCNSGPGIDIKLKEKKRKEETFRWICFESPLFGVWTPPIDLHSVLSILVTHTSLMEEILAIGGGGVQTL